MALAVKPILCSLQEKLTFRRRYKVRISTEVPAILTWRAAGGGSDARGFVALLSPT